MGGFVRDVDRAIGALSTLCLGLSIYLLREVIRKGRDVSWSELFASLTRDSANHHDIYHKIKYGLNNVPLFQHSGACECATLRFLILAPKQIDAFDDSHAVASKKGRFPYILVPISCFEMLSDSCDISVYESEQMGSQHVFCGKCGIHILHYDRTQPDVVAVNLYCVEEETFDNVRVVFIPRGARPLVGSQPCSSASSVASSSSFPCGLPSRYEEEQTLYAVPAYAGSVDSRDEDAENAQISFQKQLMMWAGMDDPPRSNPVPIPMPMHHGPSSYCARNNVATEDTLSTASSSHSRHLSFASEDPSSNLMPMKEQLEYYLKRHMDPAETTSQNATTNACV